MAKHRITTLVENTAGGTLLGEHGLSFLMETPKGAILFDTGQGRAIGPNVDALGVDLSHLSAIALSHGHYDHTGGLSWALERCGGADVYMHPAALEPKFACRPGAAPRSIGIPIDPEELKAHANVRRMVFTEGPTEVLPGFFLTGEVPRVTDFEDTGGPFYKDAEGSEPDGLPDDQALYFECDKGLVVVLGCAHSGVVNTLRYISNIAGRGRLHAVFGGMHLGGAGPERLTRTFDAFEELGVEQIGACHCTGLAAAAGFWEHFPGRCFECRAGTRLEF